MNEPRYSETISSMAHLLMKMAQDQRPYPGLYFVREQALYALRVVFDADNADKVISTAQDDARKCLEEIALEQSANAKADWPGNVPEEQHFGTSPSFSPVADLRFTAGTVIIYSERAAVRSAILNDTQITSGKIVELWRKSEWKDSVLVALEGIIMDKHVPDHMDKDAWDHVRVETMGALAHLGITPVNMVRPLVGIFQDASETGEVRRAAGLAIFQVCQNIKRRVEVDLGSITGPLKEMNKVFGNAIDEFNEKQEMMLSLESKPEPSSDAYITVDDLLNSLANVMVMMRWTKDIQATKFSPAARPVAFPESPAIATESGGGGAAAIGDAVKYNFPSGLVGTANTMGVSDTGGSTKSQLAMAMSAMHLDIFAIGDLLKAIDMPKAVKDLLGARLTGKPEDYEGKTLRNYLIDEKPMTGVIDGQEGPVSILYYYINIALPYELQQIVSVPGDVAIKIAEKLYMELEEAIDTYDTLFMKTGHATLYRNSVQNMIMIGYLIKNGGFCYEKEADTAYWYRNIYGINMAFIKFAALIESTRSFTDARDVENNYPKISQTGSYPLPISIYPNDLFMYYSNRLRKISQDYISHTPTREGVKVERMSGMYDTLPANYLAHQVLGEAPLNMIAPGSFWTSISVTLMSGKVCEIMQCKISDTRSLTVWILPIAADNEETIGMSVEDLIMGMLDSVGALPNIIMYVSTESFGNITDVAERGKTISALSSGPYSGPFAASARDIANIRKHVRERMEMEKSESGDEEYGIIDIITEDAMIAELGNGENKRAMSQEEWKNLVVMVPLDASEVIAMKMEPSRIDGAELPIARYVSEYLAEVLLRVRHESGGNRPVFGFPFKANARKDVSIKARVTLVGGRVVVEGEGLDAASRELLEESIDRYLKKEEGHGVELLMMQLLRPKGVTIEITSNIGQIADHEEGIIELHSDIFAVDITDENAKYQLEQGLDMILEHEFFHMTRWLSREQRPLASLDEKIEEEKSAIWLTASTYKGLEEHDRSRLRNFIHEFAIRQGLRNAAITDMFGLFDLIDRNASQEDIDSDINRIAEAFVRDYEAARVADAKASALRRGEPITVEVINEAVTLPDLRNLNKNLFILNSGDREALAKDGKVIIAWDTGISNANAIGAAQEAEALVKKYLGDAVIHVRGTGAELVEKVKREMAANEGNIRSIVTVAGNDTLEGTTAEEMSVELALRSLQTDKINSTVLNIQSKDAEGHQLFISVPALYDLALSIGFDCDAEKIRQCLRNIGEVIVDDAPLDPMAIDADRLKAMFIIRILPKARPVDTNADMGAQSLAREALRTAA